MQRPAKCLALLAVLLLPSRVFAQASLTGTVRDASGAVLPGVTVEAASDVLIEKTRAAVTDGTGQYRIIDLRPGTYVLTATLPGFATFKRDNIELTGTQTITIPIEMRVGAIEESVVVTGESPVVDVQTARRELVMRTEVIQTLPLARAAGALLNATPGLSVDTNGPALSPTMTFFNANSSTINAGSVAGEGRMTVNGFTVAAARSGGVSSYVYDTPNAEEVAIVVGGGLGESDIGGPVMNLVPKSGGNTFSGTAFFNNAGDWSRGDNLTADLQARNPNLTQTPGILQSFDASVSYGGPIKKDRLWFFASYRNLDTQTAMEGISANANAGNAARWDWAGSPINARLVQDRQMIIGRVMGQFGKHRIRFNSEYQHRCEGTPLKVETSGCHNRGADWIGLGNNAAPFQSPEATSTAARGYFDVPFYLNQASWTMVKSTKLLLEAGYTPFRYNPIFGHPPPDGITNLIPVTEQSNAVNAATGQRYAPQPNYTYRGVQSWGWAVGKTDGWQATASYVTGAQSMKMGYQGNRLDQLDQTIANQTQLAYRFNQGVPNAVSYYLPDFGRRTITTLHGAFIQDTWTSGPLTVQGALRYDRASSYAPVEQNGTTKSSFLNPTPIQIVKTPGVDAYNDLTPRIGVAYDLFHNGKTALKFNWGKYLAYAANDPPYTSTNPGFTVVRDVQNRQWNASVAAGGNGDLVVDCNLLNPAANGECAAATGTAPNFGKAGAATEVDPGVLSGWGVRPSDRQFTVTLQQQLLPRVSADVTFTHRSFHGFFVTDDLNRRANGVASYYETYTLTAPQDPRLANGGGYPITVYVPTAAANAVAPRLFMTRETDIGPERKSVWDGFGFTVNARLRSGLTTQIGAGTGRGLVDTCDTVTKFNNVAAATGAISGPDPRGCHNAEPWQTTVRGLATYTMPRVDVLISMVVRSQPEVQLSGVAVLTGNTSAQWQLPNSVIAAALGHLPPGATATGTTTIPLADNDHRIFSGERRTQVDMRFAKVLRFGHTRSDVGVDLNNLLNTNYATGFSTTYIYTTDNVPRPGGWGVPTSIYGARFVRINYTLNF
jgi:Carboxypeptidase regulatory-like domain